MSDTKIVDAIVQKQGFEDYKWISPKDIIVANWVRMKCTYGCGGYGMGTCPPNTPSVQDCKSFFEEYEKGILIKFSKLADKDNYPSEWSKEVTNKLLETEREVFLNGFHKSFLLNQTCCSRCDDCAKSREDCIDKERSRPSPESFAVDVYQTVRNAGFEINVVKESRSEMTRVAILLVE